MALTGNTMLSYDQIYAMGSGESFLLDTLFDGDQNAYDTATVVCDSLTMGYMDMCMQYYAANAGTSTAVADDVDDGTGQGTTGSVKLNTSAADADGADVSPSGTGTKASSTSSTASASIADDGVEQPKTTNSKVAGVAGDNADTPETVKPKTTNTTDDGETSGTGASGKKSGLYMEEMNIEDGTGVKYSPINPGPLKEEVANSFNGATYTERVLTEDTVMYRVSGGNAGEVGSYMSTTPQGGGLQSQLDLALNPAWGNTTENVTKVIVPKGTTIYEGIAAPQNIYDSLGNVVGTLPGGGNQVYIPTVEVGWFQ